MDPLQLVQQRAKTAKRHVAFNMFITASIAILWAVVLCFHYSVVGLEEENQRLEDINCTNCTKNVTKWVELNDYYLKPFPLPTVLVAMLAQSNYFLISVNMFTAITNNDFIGCTQLLYRRGDVDFVYYCFLMIYFLIGLVTGSPVGFIPCTLLLLYWEALPTYYFKWSVHYWIVAGPCT